MSVTHSIDAPKPEAKDVAKEAGNAVAAVADAAGITAAVNAGLIKDNELSAFKISVDTKDGVVTISGPVKTAADKEHAARLAQAIEGVKSVVNQLNPTAG